MERAAELEELLEYRNLNAVSVSPDGSQAVFIVGGPNLEDNRLGTALWSVDLAGGRAAALTDGEGRVENAGLRQG